MSVGDTALGDDVERIRELRNTMYGHVATTSLPDSTYNHYMQILYDICHRMDTVHAGSLTSPSPRSLTYCQTLRDIQTCCMDPVMEAKYLDEIRRMKETDQDTRDLIEGVRKDTAGRYILVLFRVFMVLITKYLHSDVIRLRLSIRKLWQMFSNERQRSRDQKN